MQTEIGKLKRIVLTTGCFDMFHHGHVDYLRRIKEEYPNHSLYVGVADDDSVRRLKGEKRPIVSEDDRVSMLNACKYVDWARVFDVFEDGDFAKQIGMKTLIEMVSPDVFVSGHRHPNRHAHLYLNGTPNEILYDLSDFTTTQLIGML